ncbi:hypothetical protein BIW11_04046, partial [Tropilaelaps mercedesae]
ASGSAAHHQSAFDKGAQQSAVSLGQGSFGYDHGAQALKYFGNKESSGSRESYSYDATNAYNQGAGSFSHSGSFGNVANLAAGFGQQFPQAGLTRLGPHAPGTVPVPGIVSGAVPISSIHHLPQTPAAVFSSVAGSHQQNLLLTGHAQGQGSWAYTQGHSSVKVSENKETFANKESFGHESMAGHATGAVQSAHAQNSQAGHYDKGHRLSNANHGTAVLG